MLQLILLLLLVGSGLITAENPIKVKAHLGSDLLLPVAAACDTDHSYHFHIYSRSKLIGAYDGDLQEMSGYEDRLAYDPKTCALTLKGLHKEDGTTFTVTLYISKDDRLTQSDIKYEVILQDPLTSPSYTPVKGTTPAAPVSFVSGHNSVVRGFVSVCLSMDSLVGALISLILIILGCRCTQIQDNVNYGYKINCCFTIVIQLCSISTMFNGMSHGWVLIAIPIILVLDSLMYSGYLPGCHQKVTKNRPNGSFCKFCNDGVISICKTTAFYFWLIIVLLLQVLFAGCVCFLYGNIDDGPIGQGSPGIGYVFLTIFLSIVLRIVVFIGALCYRTKCKKFMPDTMKGRRSGDPEDQPQCRKGLGHHDNDS